MLRKLLADSDAMRVLSEKAGLSPELFEKYMNGIEVTFEVLSYMIGAEPGRTGDGSDDIRALLESLGSFMSDRRGAAGKLDEVTAELRVKHRDLEERYHAMQQQMQETVSELAASLNDVKLQVSALSEDVARLNRDVRNRASNGAVKEIAEMVSDLNDSESSLKDRLSNLEDRVREAERVLGERIQDTSEKCDPTMQMVSTDPLNGIISQLTRECAETSTRKVSSKSQRVAIGLIPIANPGTWSNLGRARGSLHTTCPTQACAMTSRIGVCLRQATR